MSPPGRSRDDVKWVDVGPDDRWRPTFEERSRSLVVLAIVVGVLLLGAAFASIDDGDGDRDEEVTASSTTTTTTEATTTTMEPPEPNTIDGEAPPEQCVFDDRGARPLRDRREETVLVLNGTPKGGHAGDTTEDLESRGYTSMTPDNASIRDATSVEYLAGHCAEAVRAVFDLGIATATVGPIDPAGDVFLGRAVLLVTVGRDSL